MPITHSFPLVSYVYSVFLKKGAVILSYKWEITETFYRLPQISPQNIIFLSRLDPNKYL